MGKTPENLKEGIITPIYKKGNKKKTKNYRGITLMDSGYKIYTESIRKRLRKQLEQKKVWNKTQICFRKARGTKDAIYVLKNVVNETIKKEKGKVYVLFADMKGAFDKLLRKVIWEKAKSIIGKIWSIEERKFKEGWEKKLKLFDVLIKSVMLYGNLGLEAKEGAREDTREVHKMDT